MTARASKKSTRKSLHGHPLRKEYRVTTQGREQRYREDMRTRKGAVRIRKAEAHVVDGMLVPHTREARRKLDRFGSPPIRLEGDDFHALPRDRPPQPAGEATRGMRSAPRTRHNLGAKNEHQRAIDEVTMMQERRTRRNH